MRKVKERRCKLRGKERMRWSELMSGDAWNCKGMIGKELREKEGGNQKSGMKGK